MPRPSRGCAFPCPRHQLEQPRRGRRLPRDPAVHATLGLYGTVLDDGDRNAAGHSALLLGYEPYADDFTLAHVPGSGYYLAEQQPEAVIRHLLDFLAAA